MKLKKKNIKIAIIGYGSIGALHSNILKRFDCVQSILVITSRKIKNTSKLKFNNNINLLKVYDPDYIVISSLTSKHHLHFKFVEKNLKNKFVLIEKPIFSKKHKIENRLKNKYFINYNLRELNLIKYLKKFISKNSYFDVNINCSSFLPEWRENIEYSKSSSSKNQYGGGVLNDLSHEIDYILWLFGNFKIGYSYLSKISNLKINTNDILSSILFIKKKMIRVKLDYFSRIPERIININSNKFQLKADLIKNSIIIKRGKNRIKLIKFDDNIKNTYSLVHKKILSNKFRNLCSLKQGIIVLDYLSKFKKI